MPCTITLTPQPPPKRSTPERTLYQPGPGEKPVDPTFCRAAVKPPSLPLRQCRRPAAIRDYCTLHATQQKPRKIDAPLAVMPGK